MEELKGLNALRAFSRTGYGFARDADHIPLACRIPRPEMTVYDDH